MNSLKKGAKVFGCFALIGFSISLIITSLLFYLFFISSTKDASSHKPSSQNLRISQFNRGVGAISVGQNAGFVNLNRGLLDQEFITFRKEKSGRLNFISKLSSNEFECSGTCICRSEHDHRRLPHALSRPLGLLITAASTSVALTIAKDLFKNQCRIEWEEDCLVEQIEPEVKDCSLVDNEPIGKFSQDGDTEFFCTGHCLKNNRLKNKGALSTQKDFDCKGLESTAFVMVNRNRPIWGDISMNHYAKLEFRKILVSFCRESSVRAYTQKFLERKSVRNRSRKTFMCVGGGVETNSMHNIKCQNMNPRYV